MQNTGQVLATKKINLCIKYDVGMYACLTLFAGIVLLKTTYGNLRGEKT
jgi:hypothetical protein